MPTITRAAYAVKPFQMKVPDSILEDLQKRLSRTRWIKPVDDSSWDYGVSATYLHELVTYWQEEYSWGQQEKYLNHFEHFTVAIDSYDFHFIHQKGKMNRRLPLLLLHGWPDSFYRFHKIIPLLTGQNNEEGVANFCFDVVVPSLPGFGFTQCPPDLPQQQPMREYAKLLWRLMTEVLGYDKFVVAGGDGGGVLARIMAIDFPGQIPAIYVTDLGWNNQGIDESTLSHKEKHYLEKSKKQFMQQGAYAMVQATKPQSLAYSLTDSPVGLASWILDRFHYWSNDPGDIEKSFSKDELLTNIMIYWITNTIGASIRNYRMDMQSPSLTIKDYVKIPVGMGLFPKDGAGKPPWEFAERFLNIIHMKEMSSGGHFTAWEEPIQMTEDLFEFFGDFTPSKKKND